MSDPHDTDPRRYDLPRRPDLEAQGRGVSAWIWLVTLVAVLAIVGIAIGFNRTEQASRNQSNAPTTTGAAPSESRPPPPANPGGNASRPAAPVPNEGPR
jgi:hypothetical protein